MDTKSNKIHFAQSTGQSKLTVQSGGLYFIQDAKCLLDQPGEWYYDADERAVSYTHLDCRESAYSDTVE